MNKKNKGQTGIHKTLHQKLRMVIYRNCKMNRMCNTEGGKH